MPPLAEAEFIILLKENNEQAISLLYDKYSSALYGIILRQISDEQTANTILTDVFLCFFQNLHKPEAIEQRLFVCLNQILQKIIRSNKTSECNYSGNKIFLMSAISSTQNNLAFNMLVQ